MQDWTSRVSTRLTRGSVQPEPHPSRVCPGSSETRRGRVRTVVARGSCRTPWRGLDVTNRHCAPWGAMRNSNGYLMRGVTPPKVHTRPNYSARCCWEHRGRDLVCSPVYAHGKSRKVATVFIQVCLFKKFQSVKFSNNTVIY